MMVIKGQISEDCVTNHHSPSQPLHTIPLLVSVIDSRLNKKRFQSCIRLITYLKLIRIILQMTNSFKFYGQQKSIHSCSQYYNGIQIWNKYNSFLFPLFKLPASVRGFGAAPLFDKNIATSWWTRAAASDRAVCFLPLSSQYDNICQTCDLSLTSHHQRTPWLIELTIV